ncbi:MAG: TonB-dependent receptor plug domain-containing protein, partial [Neptuniibacter sp.]
IELSAGFNDNKTQQTISVLNLPPPSFFSLNNQDQLDLNSFYLKGNWKHLHQNGAQSDLQFVFDTYDREELYLEQDLKNYDLDYQLTLPAIGSHNLIFGMGYRRVDADYQNSYSVSILPDDNDIDLYSFFAQDELIILPEKLSLTFGSKFEHHDFTGWEIQPNLRIAYTPSPGHFTWGAISKAARTPSIAERGSNIQGGLTFPVTTWVLGNEETDSENVISYELGYRYFSSNLHSIDVAVFYNDYDDYLSFEQINPITFQMGNKLSGKSYGLELTSIWQPSASFKIAASYSYLDVEMEADNDSTDPLSVDVLNNSFAKHIVKLNSAWDINQQWSLDASIYYYDEIPIPSNYALFTNLSVDDVITTNARLSWRKNRNLELAIKANNIFDSKTLEAVGESFSTPTEIDRSIVLSVNWEF